LHINAIVPEPIQNPIRARSNAIVPEPIQNPIRARSNAIVPEPIQNPIRARSTAWALYDAVLRDPVDETPERWKIRGSSNRGPSTHEENELPAAVRIDQRFGDLDFTQPHTLQSS